jgi:hypothetical protein
LGSARLGSARLGIGPAVDPCAGTPSAGTECTGGAKYVGTFDPLDGGGVKKYMTTPADAGLKQWAPVFENNLTATSTTDGSANTVALEARGATYAAGYYCGTLSANGYSDWFLPSRNELALLYANKVAIGGFDVSGGWPASYYWSSTERDTNSAYDRIFSNNTLYNDVKSGALSVRCVRRY